jgi:hypothetical protein
MLVVRVTENVRAVQSSYYSSCPCAVQQNIFDKISYRINLLDQTDNMCDKV